MTCCTICGNNTLLQRDIRLFTNIFKSKQYLPPSLDLSLAICTYCFHAELRGVDSALLESIYATEPSMSNIDLDTFSKEHPLTTTLLNLSAGRDEYGSGKLLVLPCQNILDLCSRPITDRQFLSYHKT